MKRGKKLKEKSTNVSQLDSYHILKFPDEEEVTKGRNDKGDNCDF